MQLLLLLCCVTAPSLAQGCKGVTQCCASVFATARKVNSGATRARDMLQPHLGVKCQKTSATFLLRM